MVGDLLYRETARTERDFINSIVNSKYIVDYGIITQVNSDETVDVKHAMQLTLLTDEVLPYTLTPSVQVLWPSSSAFSMRYTLHIGDRVLLLGFKQLVDDVDITEAGAVEANYHYTRETLKAIPLCIFNTSATTTIEEVDGDLRIDSDNIELNGNTRTFVTHAELDTALQTFITALNLHVHGSAGTPPVTPMSLNIAAAETTTIFTGG